MSRTVLLFVCMCVSSLTAPLSGQDQFERQVRKQLAEVGSSLAGSGYELTHRVFVGRLQKGQTETVTFKLERGVKYAIVGVCDQDCADLDTRVMDPSEREIGRDEEKDDVPVVQFEAAAGGDYDVQVQMSDCSDSPCSYGLGVFATHIDEFDKQVRAQLEQAAGRLGQQGYTLTHDIFTGALKQGESEDVTVELDRGVRYLIVGVCDADCKDLDLSLRDRSGREIDRDVERDDYPMVAAQPSRDEKYTFRAVMAQCGDNPCRYGVGVFAR